MFVIMIIITIIIHIPILLSLSLSCPLLNNLTPPLSVFVTVLCHILVLLIHVCHILVLLIHVAFLFLPAPPAGRFLSALHCRCGQPSWLSFSWPHPPFPLSEEKFFSRSLPFPPFSNPSPRVHTPLPPFCPPPSHVTTYSLPSSSSYSWLPFLPLSPSPQRQRMQRLLQFASLPHIIPPQSPLSSLLFISESSFFAFDVIFYCVFTCLFLSSPPRPLDS